MTKDFKNNLTLLLIASMFAVLGWSASVFVDGNLFKDVCEYGFCVKPIFLSIISFYLLTILLTLVVIFI